jgi:hypothetical protein
MSEQMRVREKHMCSASLCVAEVFPHLLKPPPSLLSVFTASSSSSSSRAEQLYSMERVGTKGAICL